MLTSLSACTPGKSLETWRIATMGWEDTGVGVGNRESGFGGRACELRPSREPRTTGWGSSTQSLPLRFEQFNKAQEEQGEQCNDAADNGRSAAEAGNVGAGHHGQQARGDRQRGNGRDSAGTGEELAP